MLTALVALLFAAWLLEGAETNEPDSGEDAEDAPVAVTDAISA